MSVQDDNFYEKHISPILRYMIQSFESFKEQPIWFFSLVGLIVAVPLAFWIYIVNPYKISSTIPRILLILFVVVICYSLVILFVAIDTPQFSLTTFAFKTFINCGYILGFFMVFCVLYYISRQILVYSESKSLFVVLLTLFFVLCIMYKKSSPLEESFDRQESETFVLFKNIIFYIPCLLVDFMDALEKDVKGMPKSTYILMAILVVIAVFYYIIPLIQQWKIKSGKYIHLIDEATELNGEVLYMNHEKLKEKTIQMKPFFQRKLLEQTQKWEKQMNVATNPSLLDQYEHYKNITILDGDSMEYMMIKDLPNCIGKNVECQGTTSDASSGYLFCVDRSDASKKWKVRNAHDMYKRCLTHEKGSAFSSLFQKNENLEVKNTSDDAPISFDDYCTGEQVVQCLNVVDANNENNLNHSLSDTQLNDVSHAYVCNDMNKSEDGSSSKYKLIQGYNDIYSNIVLFKCKPSKEGFEATMYNPDIHQLDDSIDKVDIISLLTTNEKDIIKKAMHEDSGNFAQRLRNLTDKADIQQLYMEYLSNHVSYSKIISNIHELNRTTNDYIHQETSHLIQMINRKNQIYDYNYHYGLSFWVYFDPELLKSHSSQPNGDILNYAHNPYMYYHFAEQALIMEVKNCTADFSATEPITCTPQIVYKSKDVLFQRWNHIVVNYDYGTLDLFVNNNLVATKQNISPYIQKGENTIQFGSFEKPLTHAGICNARYYEKPLNLTQIKNLYSNKSNPCK